MSKFIIPEDRIKLKVKEIAKAIEADFAGEEVVFVGVLKGAFVFLSDLVRNIEKIDVKIDFVKVSSYGMATETSGIVRLELDTTLDLRGRNVVLVEDILDTGLTLNYLKQIMLMKQPKVLKVAVLLDKYERRIVDVDVDYVGFKVPNKFLVGYGLDAKEEYRHLPYITEV